MFKRYELLLQVLLVKIFGNLGYEISTKKQTDGLLFCS